MNIHEGIVDEDMDMVMAVGTTETQPTIGTLTKLLKFLVVKGHLGG